MTDTKTSAQTLRDAAALMRERAQAATPGPWRALTTGVRGGDHWYVCDDGEALAWIAANDGSNEEQRQPDAEHIASFASPAVALAVADWLDADAKFAEESPFYADLDSEEERAEFLSNPLAVARAYLGDDA